MRKRKKLSHSNFHQWCLCIVLLMMSLDVTAQIRATKSNAYSGYWKLIKTNIIQHEDTHNENGSYTLYTASATEHTKQGKAWGIVGPYDDKELFDFSFSSSIQAPPDRITADSLVLHTVVRRLSEDAPCYIREMATLTFEDTNTFLRHGCPEGVIRKLKGTKGVGTWKEHGNHGEWDFVIRIPKGNKDEEKALNFFGCNSRTQWVYRWCEDTWAETPPPGEEEEDEEEEVIGPHVEVDTRAWQPDTALPFAIPASVILGMLGYTLTRGKRKGKDEMPEPREMHLYKDFGNTLVIGDEPKQVYAKIVRKTKSGEDVTDVELTSLIRITAGDKYMKVEDGGMSGEWRMAWVSVPEVKEKKLVTEGDVTKEVEEVVEPEEGIVDFYMGNDKGSYTNHLHFDVCLGQIYFLQDNLTLPAQYKKETKLPFLVVGMNDGTAQIKAYITEQGKEEEVKDYSIRTEWDEEKQCYHAIIHDQLLDPEQDVGVPGNYLAYTIHLEARKQNAATVIYGTMPLNRFYMGLVMRMDGNVNCFLEEYNPMYHDHELIVREDGKEYAPAQQKCFLELYEYDEEKHKLNILDPTPKNVTWTVKYAKAEKVMRDIIGNEMMKKGLDITLSAAGLGAGIGTLVSQAHNQVFKQEEQQLMSELSFLNNKLPQDRLMKYQEYVKSLCLQFKAEQESIGEHRIYYMLRCAGGVLRAPNRIDVEMEVTAEYKGKEYSFKRMVHLLSQPKREYDDPAEREAQVRQDEEIEKGLNKVEGEITLAGLTEELAPLLLFIRLQIDFYEQEYGYDARNIRIIKDFYRYALECVRDKQMEKVRAMNAVDDIEKFSLDWFLELSYEGHDLLENMNWLERIGVAVLTFGYSELVFNIPYKMRESFEKDLTGKMGAYDAFTVGAWEATTTWAIEFGVGAVFTVGGALAKAGAKSAIVKIGAKKVAEWIAKFGGKDIAKEVSEMGIKKFTIFSLRGGGKTTKQVMQTAKEVFLETLETEACTGLKTLVKKQVTWEVGIAERAIISKAQSLLAGLDDMLAGSKYAVAEKFAKQQAIENISNLQTMIEMCRQNPTRENVLMRNQLVLRCQADKQTMMLLKSPKLMAGEPLLQGQWLKTLKQDFNGLLKKIYNETDDLVKRDLADATHGTISVSEIKVLNASSSKTDLLKLGLDVTFDRDITYYWVDANGTNHYFSQLYVERLYAKHFRNIVNEHTLPKPTAGFNRSALTTKAAQQLEAQEAKQAAIATKLYDQTVVEDILGHVESYGDDLLRMIKPELHGEVLQNPAKVAEAVLHKGTSRFNYADKLWKEAEAATGWEKEYLQGRCVSEMMEGCRQLKKVFQLLMNRDTIRNTVPKIPKDLKEAVKIIWNLDGVNITLSQAEVLLKTKGYTFQSLAEAVSNAVYIVA